MTLVGLAARRQSLKRRNAKLANAFPNGVRCQKCLEMGHWSFECKDKRKYVHRTSRTKQLSKHLAEKNSATANAKQRFEVALNGVGRKSPKAKTSTESSDSSSDSSDADSESGSSSESESDSSDSDTSESSSSSSSSSESSSDSSDESDTSDSSDSEQQPHKKPKYESTNKSSSSSTDSDK